MLCFSPKSEPSRASGGIFLVVRGLIWVGSAADWNESSDIAAPYNSIPGQMDKSFERTLSPNPWSSHVMQNSGMSKRFSYTNTLTFTQPRIHSQVSLISCCTAGCGQKQQKGAEASVYLVLLVSWHQGTDVRGHLVRFSHSSAFLPFLAMDEVTFQRVCETILFSVLTHLTLFASFCLCHTWELCGCLITVT